MAFETAPIRGQQMTIKSTGGQSRGMSVGDALAILDRFKSKGGGSDSPAALDASENYESQADAMADPTARIGAAENYESQADAMADPGSRLYESENYESQYDRLTSSDYGAPSTPQEIEAGQSGKYDDPLAESSANAGFNLGDPNRAFAAPDMAKSELALNTTKKTGMEGAQMALKTILALYGGG